MNNQIKSFPYIRVTRWIKILFLGLAVILLGVLGLRPTPAQSDTGIHRGPGGLYEYGIARHAGQPTEIHVVFDLNNEVAAERYRQAGNQRALKLLKSAPGERLWTTITFAKPLPLNEMVLLLKEAEVEPVSYTWVGWTASGERMGSTLFASPEFDLEKLAEEAVSASSDEEPIAGTRMAGFIVVDGYITISKKSLERLLVDERVYLVDTTAYEVQRLVGQEAQNASFHLSSPFWGMNWDK